MPGTIAAAVGVGHEFNVNRTQSKLAARMAEFPFMIGLGPDFVKLIARGAREKNFEKGDTLFLAGEPADRFFLVIYGAVSLEFAIPEDRHSSLQTVVSGEVVGWSWMTPPYRWTSDARALCATRTIAIDGSYLRRICNENPEDGYRFMLRLVPVIASRLDNARGLLVDMYDRRSGH